LNGATCDEHNNESAYCLCKPGFTGLRCETEYFRCQSNGLFADPYGCSMGKYLECAYYGESNLNSSLYFLLGLLIDGKKSNKFFKKSLVFQMACCIDVIVRPIYDSIRSLATAITATTYCARKILKMLAFFKSLRKLWEFRCCFFIICFDYRVFFCKIKIGLTNKHYL
jgi:hypothetical protein